MPSYTLLLYSKTGVYKGIYFFLIFYTRVTQLAEPIFLGDLYYELQISTIFFLYFSQDITKCLRDECKDDSMAAVIQSIVKQGIERIELRDEILCQLIRQTNDNPDTSSLTLAWLFLCLCTASFSPSKNLHKVSENTCKRLEQNHFIQQKRATKMIYGLVMEDGTSK